jgi:peptidoglycan/LPS O-acetylase OafA/YrhL
LLSLFIVSNYIKVDYVGEGGFIGIGIGIDILFVLSGYLILTIIVNNLETNTFSFKEF